MARRNPWIWISALLLLVVIGLVIWALSLRSDLDDTEQQVADLQAQIDESQSKGDDIAAAAKSLADDVRSAVGSAGEDLDAAKAQIEELSSRADDAQTRASIATDCAKAYAAAFSALAGAEDIEAQIPALRDDLESISADCKAALEGG